MAGVSCQEALGLCGDESLGKKLFIAEKVSSQGVALAWSLHCGPAPGTGVPVDYWDDIGQKSPLLL